MSSGRSTCRRPRRAAAPTTMLEDRDDPAGRSQRAAARPPGTGRAAGDRGAAGCRDRGLAWTGEGLRGPGRACAARRHRAAPAASGARRHRSPAVRRGPRRAARSGRQLLRRVRCARACCAPLGRPVPEPALRPLVHGCCPILPSLSSVLTTSIDAHPALLGVVRFLESCPPHQIVTTSRRMSPGQPDSRSRCQIPVKRTRDVAGPLRRQAEPPPGDVDKLVEAGVVRAARPGPPLGSRPQAQAVGFQQVRCRKE